MVACGDVVACGVLLVVVGTGLAGLVAGAEVAGVSVYEVPVPGEEVDVGLTSNQAARATRKMAMRTQVEVRIRRISRTSRISRIRISRSRPVRSVPRYPVRSAG